MSSKIPVRRSIGVDDKRPMKQISPNTSSSSFVSSASPNTSGTQGCTSKSIKDKYAHITPKVKTHWSYEERQRMGLREYFDRMSGQSAGSSLNSSATTLSPDTEKPKNKRLSLPLPVQDPIAVAIAQIKQAQIARNTRLYSFSETSESTTSMASIEEQ